jgi:glycosyltransferase involved in cell wall biosynthesis
VVDYGGPGELVNDECGFRVPIGSRSQIVARFRSILEKLAAEPFAVQSLSNNAISFVTGNFTWQKKAEHTLQIYRSVTGSLSRSPHTSELQTG